MFNPLKNMRLTSQYIRDSNFGFWILIFLTLTILSGSAVAWGSHLTIKELPPALQRMHRSSEESPDQPKKSPISPDKHNTTTYIGISPPKRHSSPAPETKIRSSRQFRATTKPHAHLGWNFLLNGQPKAAIAAYRQALRINPKSAKAYLGLGITLKALGSAETAKRALIQAANLNPRLPSALVHLGYLYADGQLGHPDSKRARQLFSQAAQLGDPFAQIALLDLKSRPRL